MALGTKNHMRLAIANLRHNRGRSVLTMIGVMIGVMSVILIIAIGEGVKQQISSDTSYLGDNVIAVQPASGDTFLQPNRVSLSLSDAEAISKLPDVAISVPFAAVSGVIDSRFTDRGEANIIAAGAEANQLLGDLVEYGGFAGGEDTSTVAAVIGSSVAAQIFDEQVPLGQSFTLRGQRFIVQGVLKDVPSTPLTPAEDLNNSVIIPFATAQQITGNNLPVYQVLARISDGADPQATTNAVREAVTKNHGGQQDFAVLAPGEKTATSADVLSAVTYAIAAIAAISLIVGGIGIMNVMLVSVTERTHEIGIRKAIGATNRQILNQFMIEATVISVAGGVIGVIASFAIDGLLRLLTDFRPVISWQVAAGAFVVTLLLGIIFGTAPAIKAAKKDPIEALRNA